MDKITLLTAALLIAAVVILFMPPKWDPAIRIKERQFKNGTHPESDGLTALQRADRNAIEKGVCPECGSSALLGGPSGGLSMNVLCNHCLSEFNVHGSLGMGLLGVDRSGKANQSRAAVFGIDEREFRDIEDRLYREALP